ncbi:GNAT family N-acetyltransferase [Actinoallomurus acaciae]|uniref:GNAT family N-acetyltransferase n=1 Tax=Actinoallomurus acaciae TaxID=502577 RepID=A0ABV5Y7P4_9ACTN
MDQVALGKYITGLAARKEPYWKEAVLGESWPVARSGSKVVGFCQIARKDADQSATIGGLYVDPEYHRAGLGRRLVDTALNGLNRPLTVYLDVAKDTDAPAFYRRYGFTPDGVVETPQPLRDSGINIPFISMKLELS